MVRPPSIPFSDGESSLDRLIGQKWKQTNKQRKPEQKTMLKVAPEKTSSKELETTYGRK